jgi:hypothetical protein
LKKTIILAIFCFVFITTEKLDSQGLSVGAYSGVNISDIHGNDPYGKWRFMNGPIQGIFADYNLKRWLGLSTGVRYLSIYYEHRNYNSGYYYMLGSSSYRDPFLSSSIWPPPYHVKYDFSMLNIPVQAKLTIPSTPDLYIAAGTYWSFTTSKPEYMEGGKKDFGYIFNAGISAPLGEVFKANLSTGYSTGRKQFMSYRHGYYEVTLGIAYTGFLIDNHRFRAGSDTTGRISIVYYGGVNVAWNGKGKYAEKQGVKAGFMIDIPIGQTAAFRTGLSFEQSGYSLNDSTDHFFAVKSDYKSSYHADTKVTIDYIIIPATFKFNIGKKSPVHVNFGPYAALKLNARVTGEAISVLNYGSTYTRTQITVFDDITGLFEGSDLGLTAGAGINLPFFGKYRSEAGVSYRAGLKNVFEPGGSNNQYSGIEVMNRSLAFHFGIILPVKK